jgi:hypothetical protein
MLLTENLRTIRGTFLKKTFKLHWHALFPRLYFIFPTRHCRPRGWVVG